MERLMGVSGTGLFPNIATCQRIRGSGLKIDEPSLSPNGGLDWVYILSQE
jgi:hypothetical protein